MIKAVVYTSNTGFTARYAKMLGEELGVPVFSLNEAKNGLKANDKIAYLGWLMAGTVKGLKKASAFEIKAVCGVGMALPTSEERERLCKLNEKNASFKDESFFILQGGLDMSKLKGINHIIMKILAKVSSKIIAKKIQDGTATASDKDMFDIVQNGKDCTSKDALVPVIEYIKANA